MDKLRQPTSKPSQSLFRATRSRSEEGQSIDSLRLKPRGSEGGGLLDMQRDISDILTFIDR